MAALRTLQELQLKLVNLDRNIHHKEVLKTWLSSKGFEDLRQSLLDYVDKCGTKTSIMVNNQPYQVSFNATTNDLKQELAKQHDLTPSQITLKCGETTLNDTTNLCEYGGTFNAYAARGATTYRVNIRSKDHTTYAEFKTKDTVFNVKEQIAKHTGVPIEKQDLQMKDVSLVGTDNFYDRWRDAGFPTFIELIV